MILPDYEMTTAFAMRRNAGSQHNRSAEANWAARCGPRAGLTIFDGMRDRLGRAAAGSCAALAATQRLDLSATGEAAMRETRIGGGARQQ
ncbi:hypothetical protein [Burkholderia sp. Ac-20379]|uniref:hypothetical protein n=1 Tax=Burkholderia sp. Ac-20379 TaxID=2703900 RepID=UPI001981D2A8|nr:hypothetical protein [Burkholderia sp. Ac-20379]MBN3726521.1 hypothetical protein [Burkholderia sp. Ac-20379]